MPEKAAASVLIQHAGTRLVYDFGRGVAIRLTELGLRQNDVQYIFISHAHPDHLTDLFPFLHAASWSQIDKRTANLSILCTSETKNKLDRLLHIFGSDEMHRGFAMSVSSLTGISEMHIGDAEYKLVDLHHSYELAFGDAIVAGDSSMGEHLVKALQCKKLAVFDAGRLSDDEIAALAVATNAKKMVCSHQYRPLNAQSLNDATHQLGYTGNLIVAADKQVFRC